MSDKSIDSMNDEEFLEHFHSLDLDDAPAEGVAEPDDTEAEEVEEGQEDTDTTDEEEDTSDGEKAEDTEEAEEETEADSADEADITEEVAEGTEEDTEADTDVGYKPPTAEEAQAQLSELYKPFKANGVDMQIRSIAEATRLMQQGANYSLKMRNIKPHLRRVQTLEQNEITDDDINLLVDLKKGDKGAIKQLLKNSKVDALDLDLDEETDYTPTDYGVTQSQADLTSVLEEIRDSEAYPETIRIVGTEWDAESRSEVSKNPTLVKGIHDQVANGDYAIVKAEMDRERALGRLTDVNDLAAYIQTYQRLDAARQAASPAPVQPRSNGGKVDPKEAARRKAKAAAATTKPKAKTAAKASELDIANMDDDAFMKEYEKTYQF